MHCFESCMQLNVEYLFNRLLRLSLGRTCRVLYSFNNSIELNEVDVNIIPCCAQIKQYARLQVFRIIKMKLAMFAKFGNIFTFSLLMLSTMFRYSCILRPSSCRLHLSFYFSFSLATTVQFK